MRIKINLLPGGKRKRGGGGGGAHLPDFKALLAKVKDPLLIGAVATWAVAIAIIAVMFVTQGATKARLAEEKTEVEREHARFRGLLNRTQRARALEQSLLAELDAIREIDRDRYVWPHIMTDVSMALPQFAWLREIRPVPGQMVAAGDTVEPPLQILIAGQTVNVQAYTRFLRGLAESPWLRDVTDGPLVAGDDAQGTRIWSFTVTATFRQADASIIQTVPVADWLQ